MNREEMFAKMQGRNGFGVSQLHMRSENAQNQFRVKRIPRLKKALRKKSKLLVILDLALPFDPKTGTETEVFNSDRKFRPPYSATTVALLLKRDADSNENLKNALMRRAGVSEWDTSNYDELTKEDWVIFKRYRVPRIFSVPVVHVNIPAMTKSGIGTDFELNVEYDDTGAVIGELPGVLKVNKLFRDIVYEELSDYQAKLDKGVIKRTDQQQKDDKREMFKKNPVSDVHPSNWVTAIELPLTGNYTLNGEVDYNSLSVSAVEKLLVVTKYSHNLRSAIEQYVAGSYEKFDVYFDYYSLDMCCPADGDDSTNEGKMQIGLNTSFEKPTNQFCDPGMLTEDQFHKFSQTVIEYLDGCDDIEKEVRRSIFIRAYTTEVESSIYSTLSTVLNIEDNKFLTQRVIDANREVISLAFNSLGEDLIDATDAGVSDRSVGSLDEAESQKAASEYDLDSDEFQDDYEVDEVELA